MRALRDGGERIGVEVVKRWTVCWEEGTEHLVRGGAGGGLLGSASGHSSLYKVGFVAAAYAVDSVVN